MEVNIIFMCPQSLINREDNTIQYSGACTYLKSELLDIGK